MNIIICTGALFFNRVNWFDEIGKYANVKVMCYELANNEADSRILNTPSEHIRKEYIKSCFIPGLGNVSFGFVNEIKKNYERYDIIVLDGYGSLTQLINMVYLNRHKIDYFVNVDGMFYYNDERYLKRRIKERIISRIPHFLSGAIQSNDVLTKYGANSDNIFNHVFTSLYKSDIAERPLSKAEKTVLKNELGMREVFIIITVGRFSFMNGYGKGYDVIIKASKKMSSEIGWYIIGDEPTQEFIGMAKGCSNIHFEGFKTRKEIKKYYQAADLFVLMSISEAWGLVINEAMAVGLPVITTNQCIGGCELINNNKNGFLLEVGDVNGLINKIEYLLYNERIRASMGKESLHRIQDYTIENMGLETINAFKLALKDKDKNEDNQ